jgi:uncharacterized protein YgiM (DUF1202 family)
MNYRRATTILLMGLSVMLLSGLGGYYWASSSNSKNQIRRKTVQKPKPKQPTEQEIDPSVDTEALTAENWEAFLEYDGKRQRMLGVRKEFNEVNFRGGPGMEYSIIDTPEGGTLLQILDRVRNWYRARLKSGRIGWIHQSVIRVLNVPQPVAQSFNETLPPLKDSTKELTPEDFKDHTRVSITVQKAHLRRGPGMQFARAGQLYQYQEVRLLGKRNNWYRIVTPTGSTVWVRTDLARPIWKIPPKNQTTLTITTRDVRMGPEYQFRNPVEANANVEATLLERQPPWYLVKLNDKTIGWVNEKEIVNSETVLKSSQQ